MSFGIPVRNGLGVGLLASTFLSSLRIGGRPAMSLDFIGTNSLDSRVTFTRGTTATFVGSNGLLQTAAINAPRFDYDPVTLAPKGLLIEEARTNIFLESAGFDTASWNKGNASVTANAATAPDGTLTADKLVEDATVNFHRISQVPTLTAVPHTATIYAKPAGRDWIYIANASLSLAAYFNVSTGVVGTIVGAATATITPANNGYYRCSLTSTPLAALQNYSAYTANADGSFIYAGDGVSGLHIWGAQLEAGAFATSYIPTTTLAVTRNADVASMTGTNFSSWYNASEGTLFCAYQIASGSGTARGAWRISDGTNANSMDFRPNGGDYTVTTGGVSQADIYPGGGTIGAVNKSIFAYTLNDFAASTNGGTVVTDGVGTIPVVTQLNIGALLSVTGQILSGNIRQITYYNTRLPNTTLRALTV